MAWMVFGNKIVASKYRVARDGWDTEAANARKSILWRGTTSVKESFLVISDIGLEEKNITDFGLIHKWEAGL